MSEKYSIEPGTIFAFEEEAVEGTPPTPDANDAVLLKRGASLRIGREEIDRELMYPSLSELGHIIGKYDDVGFDFTTEGRASGTQGTPPEIADMLKNVMGDQNNGVATTVSASPAPTTTGCTVASGTGIETGHILRLQTGTTTYEYAVCKSVATNAITWWPPVSVAPSSGYAVQPGVKFALKSDVTDFVSGCGFFWMKNGSKFTFPGARGTVTIKMAVGQPLLFDWKFNALSYSVTQAAALASPVLNITTKPPICLGILAYAYYDGIGVTGSTTTSTIVSATPGWEAKVGDLLIIDKGSSVYESQVLTSWTYATQTADHAAFSEAIDAGEDCYLRRALDISNLEIEIAPEWVKAESMASSHGAYAQVPVTRAVNIKYDAHFKSDFELAMRDNLTALEILAVYGSTAGNIIAISLPNVLLRGVDLKLDALQGQSLTAQAYLSSSAGDDEIAICFL